MGLQVGFQGKLRWQTSQAQLHRCRDPLGPTQAAGPIHYEEIPNISKRVRLTFEKGNQGKRSMQSCTKMI